MKKEKNNRKEGAPHLLGERAANVLLEKEGAWWK